MTKCPLHKVNHSLNQCKGFRAKPIKERKELIRKFGMCYRCCSSTSHLANKCKESVQCDICCSDTHPTALHVSFNGEVRDKTPSSYPAAYHGGEEKNKEPAVASKCTQICGLSFSGKSCAKTILVNIYAENQPHNFIRTYAVLDDQSNASLAKPELFNLLGVQSEHIFYSLSSCSGTVKTSGRKVSNLIVESFDQSATLMLPTLIECNNIPNVREEIPTPQVAENYPHLRDIRQFIPAMDNDAEILLLIGRDLLEAHHVQDQRTGPRNTPFAQKLHLGWVIVGQACLGGIHQPTHIHTAKTSILSNGRPSMFDPCPNKMSLKEQFCDRIRPTGSKPELGKTFERTPEDEKPGMSQEDMEFLDAMKTMSRNENGNWVAPLPFRPNRQHLPNNRSLALPRALSLKSSLLKNSKKREHFVSFIQRMLHNGHAEIAPPLGPNEECWYLPMFGVYHPKKKDEIRVVFDSSAVFDGVSLNSVLMTGPDLVNSLLGVLMRFRKERVAITADIEQMFYCFYVQEDQRNFLRFLCHKDDDPTKPLIDYRMCVHVFGNAPSPAIATYGLRRTAELGEETYGSDMKDFIEKDFYVDDGVTSFASSDEAIDLLQRTKLCLKTFGNLRLHKIASNSVDVMNVFPTDELAKAIRGLDLGTDGLPVQRSLGLVWDMATDTFTFKLGLQDKPYTRRGILSTVKSLFDPLGFASPVSIQGKLFLRDLISHTKDWDEPLPPEHEADWNKWKGSVKVLETLHIPRTSLMENHGTEIHVFANASEKAISAAAYLKTIDDKDNEHWSFVLGKAKVAPLNAHTIPRLELCAAVLSTEIYEVISEHCGFEPTAVKFHTDSKIVLGYIYNKTRRFNVYVTNRISKIRRSSSAEQWNFVPTHCNPADQATRPIDANQLASGPWLNGPRPSENFDIQTTQEYSLVDPDNDVSVKPIIALSTNIRTTSALGSARFQRFSSWDRLVKAIATLKRFCNNFQGSRRSKQNSPQDSGSVDLTRNSACYIMRTVQKETYPLEFESLNMNNTVRKNSPLVSLNPFIDQNGLLRVGGRLQNAEMADLLKHPIIIPGRHHIATLLVIS